MRAYRTFGSIHIKDKKPTAKQNKNKKTTKNAQKTQTSGSLRHVGGNSISVLFLRQLPQYRVKL